ncbi:MAG TPA: hypothetical protein VLM91_08555 [Candidatus Methylomirabilis sp.]|nr:hypothetical protein [Candidatus Methylomirabilis sp.]
MRRNRGWRVGAVMVTFLLLLFGALELDAWARAGGGRSFGGGNYRSFSTPYSGFSCPVPRSVSPSYQAPSPAGTQSWDNGGFIGSASALRDICRIVKEDAPAVED